tara:strand:+ start:4114 stop:5040 length:927 start_codon:yes stop_codon:yes gene_type:complete
MALNIIFMGTPEFAVPILNSIFKSDHKILQVYTQPPRKKNRGQKINISQVHKFSIENKIDVSHPETFDDKEVKKILNLNPNVVVVVAYGKILPVKLLDNTKIKFINIHASLLPKWRGAAPIQRALMNLDKETGVSIMKILPKLDTGPVMMQSKIKIDKKTDFERLSNTMALLSAKMILQSLDLIEKRKAKFFPQDETKATYATKLDKKEYLIDWNDDSEKVAAKIKALYPKPGSWFLFKGSRIKVLKVEEVKAKGNPGEIIKSNFTIACGSNAVRLLEIQKEGKKRMSIDDYLKANNLKVGFNVKKNF